MPLSPSRQQLLLVDDEEDALLELAELLDQGLNFAAQLRTRTSTGAPIP